MDLEEQSPKRAKRRSSTNKKVALGATGVVSLFGIGSTLASNITLNTGASVEFGQGHAAQVACSTSGFSVTPESTYDNASHTFVLTALHISGLDLTPVGANRDLSPEAFPPNSAGLAASIAAHPGQYWDTVTNAWKETCDNVVLDFQLYTTDPQYTPYTYGAKSTGGTTEDTNSPLLFNTDRVIEGIPDHQWVYGANSDVAVIWNNNSQNVSLNYGVAPTANANGTVFNIINTSGMKTSTASFDIAVNELTGNYNWNAPSAAISKITVETMQYFPKDYLTDDICNNHSYDVEYNGPFPGCTVS